MWRLLLVLPSVLSWPVGNPDRRCRDALVPYDPRPVAVSTPQGSTVEGRVVFLCDGPGTPAVSRPSAHQANFPVQNIFANLTVFYGIPYAKPPTGPLRFKKPQVSAWKLANQQDYQLACPQHYQYYGQELGVRDISEDCLYLNIFTPYARPTARDKFAVMVYIHGGFWDHGSANTFPPHMLVASQQVVVVSFNFRLGPLGFLATGDGASPGNYGLLDQRMAIQWVYDNIEAFNGDRERITLFGPGAGAASAGLHLLSPSSNRMVRRVIAQSGSAIADWAVVTRPSIVNSSAFALARQVGCSNTRDSWKMVECLRRVPFTDMIGLTMRPEAGWTMWSPVVDGQTRDQSFITSSPQESLQSSAIIFRPDIAYMSGVTRTEGSTFLKEEIKEPNHDVTPEILHRRIWDYIRMYNFTLDRAALIKAIEFMYWPASDRNNHTLLRQAYIELLSDSYINAPSDKMVKLLMQRGVRTFLYVLNYTMEGLPQKESWDGVPHNHEYFMITGAPFMDHSIYPPYLNLANARWTESDRNMSNLLMTLWANFAKHGDPTPVLLYDHILWRESSLDSMRFLMINNTNHTTRMVDGGYRQKESQFWSEYLPSSVLSTDSPPIWSQPEWQYDRQRYQIALSCVAGLAALCFVLMVLCCCLYCRSRRKHVVEDEDVQDGTTPTASNAFLDIKQLNSRDLDEDEVIPSRSNKHTMV